MAKALSVAEVEAHFSECVESALQDGYVMITRYGKPVAAIVSFEDLEQLQRIRAARQGGGLANLAEGWENPNELAEELDMIVQERYGYIAEPN